MAGRSGWALGSSGAGRSPLGPFSPSRAPFRWSQGPGYKGDAPIVPGDLNCLLPCSARQLSSGISHPRHGDFPKTDAPVSVASGGERSELGLTDGKAVRLIKPFAAPRVVGFGWEPPGDLLLSTLAEPQTARGVASPPAPGRGRGQGCTSVRFHSCDLGLPCSSELPGIRDHAYQPNLSAHYISC